ncbi:bone morphogenetic protein 4-like [Pygocentrus nattereri]|uniref:TGF-beta family profile domain-containing protein n=1 Tax=Pygocentrus nattereri TaxID=42514 RepID=A0A3B4D2E2_PYGNA|nr:bone morphogenetic protein 4-like [Pygocentrus nattereri]
MTLLTISILAVFALRFFHNAASGEVEAHMFTDREASKKLSWNELLRLKELQRSKVPQFMKELYAAMVDSGGTIQEQNKLDGNVVRSYAAHSNGAFHFFNLTSFSRGEKVIKAELRWFRRTQPFWMGHHFYKADLYEMLDGRVKPWRGNLITSRLLPMNTTGWEVFNITNTATKWILNSSTNNGILVVSTLPSGQWFETTVSTGGLTKSEENDAYLVIYSDDGRRGSAKGQKSASPLDLVLESKLSQQTAGRIRRSTARFSPDHEQFVTCQRAPLYVDFARIGWSGWIISPKGYNAYHCVGSCPFPLGGTLRATNHAIVQSIVDALKLSNKIEQPCCVPDILHPISLLYFDDEENVVLKQYDDMVAGNCGCH